MIAPLAALLLAVAPADVGLDDLITRMLRAAEKVEDAEDRGYRLVQIANWQARAGDRSGARATWERAAQAVADVPGDEARFRNHVLTWVARSQARHGEPDAARATLARARTVNSAMKADVRRFDMLGEVIRQQVELGDRDAARVAAAEARELVRASGDPALRASRPRKEIALIAAAGDPAAALRAYAEAGVPAEGNPDDFRAAILDEIAAALQPGDHGLLPDLAAFAHGLTGTEARNQALGSVARAQARLGLFGAAMATAGAIDDTPRAPGGRPLAAYHKAQALGEIAEAAARAGDDAAVQAAARAAVAVVAMIDVPALRARALSRAAAALRAVGAFDEARRLLDELAPVHRLGPLLALADALDAAGDRDGARATVHEALRLAESPPPRPADAPGLPKAGGDDDAERAVRLVQVRARFGEVKPAIQALDRLDRAARPFDATEIARTLGRAGHTAEVLAWIETQASPLVQLDVLDGLAQGLSIPLGR